MALVVIAWAISEVLVGVVREMGETQRHRIAEEARTEQLRIKQAGKSPDSASKPGFAPGTVSRPSELGAQRGSESVLPGQRGGCGVIPTGMTCVNEE